MDVIVEGIIDVIIGGRFIQTLGEGEIFGGRVLIDHIPRSAHVTVMANRLRMAASSQDRCG